MTRLQSHFSYANGMATVAVFIALGGSAYAVTQLPRDSVGAAQIKRGAVGASELRRSAVSSRTIRDGSVTLRDVSVAARSSLRGAKGDSGPVGAPGAAFHAAVNSGGAAVRGNATAFHHQGGSGLYSIAFGRDVSACEATATLAAVANGPAIDQPTPGRIAVGADGPNVAVRTFDGDGAVKDQPFNVLVAC
jgi:hypothetical protein